MLFQFLLNPSQIRSRSNKTNLWNGFLNPRVIWKFADFELILQTVGVSPSNRSITRHRHPSGLKIDIS